MAIDFLILMNILKRSLINIYYDLNYSVTLLENK